MTPAERFGSGVIAQLAELAAQVAAVASDTDAQTVIAELDRIEYQGDPEERRVAYDLLLQLGARMMSDGRWHRAEQERR